MNKSNKKVLLTILDGWGSGPDPAVSAIDQGDTPFMDHMLVTYPNAKLTTHGRSVGLPEGQMGNSEVGHMNIGAGRTVFQDLVKINNDIKDGSFEKNPVIQSAIQNAKNGQSSIHLIGLVSDGGVHSHMEHLFELCRILDSHDVSNVCVHAILDGRDTDPKSGQKYLKELLHKIDQYENVHLASVIGRYYAMDRDQRWDRIKIAYDLLIERKGEEVLDFVRGVEDNYEKGITDEFMSPLVSDGSGLNRSQGVQDGDVMLFFNFRSDRPRELTMALSQKDFPEYQMNKLDLHFVTMTPYDDQFENIHIIYPKENLKGTLGEILSIENKTQLRIAETEKYAHVTFFFSGGREEAFEAESRILIPSPKVATYDLKPEMSAFEVTDAVIENIHEVGPDFICLNFANSDMVGHTGDFEAAKNAVAAVDTCLSNLIPKALRKEYEVIIIADHGNSDVMKNKDGTPNTAHSLSPVPIVFISKDEKEFSVRDGILADIAPTILTRMEIEIPNEMTGQNLISRS